MIEALIFDYGGVLIHEDPADYDTVGRRWGFADGTLWAMVHGIPEYRPSRVGILSAEEFLQAVRGHLTQQAGGAAAQAMIDALTEYYPAHERLRPPMRDLLVRLRGRVKAAVLSNGTRGSTERLVRQGLLDYVDVVLCSGDVGVAKPDPAAYRLAALRLDVRTDACIFVDDVQENVEAATAVGMHAVHYYHARHQALLDALATWHL